MISRIVAFTGAVFFIAATVVTPAQTRDSKEVFKFEGGETVFVNGTTELKVGYKTLRLISPGTPLKVISVQDDWVQVSVDADGEAVKGWVRSSTVIRASPEPESAKTQSTKTQSTKTQSAKTQSAKTDVGTEAKTTNDKPAEQASGQDESKKATETLADKFRQMLAESDRDARAKVPGQGVATLVSASPVDRPDIKTQATEPGKEKAPQKPKKIPSKIAKKDQAEPPETGKKDAKVSKPSTTEGADKTGTDDPSGKKEVGEGPERLAEKFAQIMAKRRGQETTTESSETPPEQVEETKAVAAPPKPVAKPSVQEVNQNPTISVLVLRIADDLAEVEPSEWIGQLVLSGEQFTNRSLRHLGGLSVSSLSIEAINVSNTGIQYAKDVRGIRRLRLWSPGIDDGALKLVGQLSDLEVLDIEGTAIGGTEFAELQNLQKLESVILGPKVSDATIANLKHLPALRELDLRACGRLTLACLESLEALTDLQIVWLPRHLRTKGKRALKLTLPECQVRS